MFDVIKKYVCYVIFEKNEVGHLRRWALCIPNVALRIFPPHSIMDEMTYIYAEITVNPYKWKETHVLLHFFQSPCYGQ